MPFQGKLSQWIKHYFCFVILKSTLVFRYIPDDGINTSWSLITSSSGFKTNEEVAVDDDLCKAEFWDSFSNNFSDEFVVKIASLSIRGELSIWPWEEVEDVEHYKNSWD